MVAIIGLVLCEHGQGPDYGIVFWAVRRVLSWSGLSEKFLLPRMTKWAVL